MVLGTGWNKSLIEWVFCPVTTTRILAVPLSQQGGKDVLFWTGTTDGGYTTRSGYEFIQWLVAQSSPLASTELSMAAALWRKFWKAPTLPRCKDVAWRVCMNILHVCASLRQRGVDVDSLCSLCGLERRQSTICSRGVRL